MNEFFAFAAETHGVTVRVSPQFLSDQSDPQHGRYTWSYHVRIENRASGAVQLTRRHWIITDGNGRIEEVEGPGVVGETPRLEPGNSFDYVSGCNLKTPSGTMRGSFHMETPRGAFEAEIPKFSLLSPAPRKRPK